LDPSATPSLTSFLSISSQYPTFAPASIPLLRSFISILSLYRATAPVHHSTLLASVPAIGIQFANDSEWIGDEIERVWRQSALMSKTSQMGSSQHEAEIGHALALTKKMGSDWREKQIVSSVGLAARE
jgi:hypothetical protein